MPFGETTQIGNLGFTTQKYTSPYIRKSQKYKHLQKSNNEFSVVLSELLHIEMPS